MIVYSHESHLIYFPWQHEPHWLNCLKHMLTDQAPHTV